MNDTIPDYILMDDIKHTKIELRAYKLLTEGYHLLTTVPENFNNRIFPNRMVSNSNNHHECALFLQKLKKLAEDRGIILDE